jgi:hypothetical protein
MRSTVIGDIVSIGLALDLLDHLLPFSRGVDLLRFDRSYLLNSIGSCIAFAGRGGLLCIACYIFYRAAEELDINYQK